MATNAARYRMVAGKHVKLLEFGLRRAQGPDGGLSASKYSYTGMDKVYPPHQCLTTKVKRVRYIMSYYISYIAISVCSFGIAKLHAVGP